VNVRVVAATHQSLKQMVEDEKFREDLYYRLEVIPVHLPALRARGGDVPELVEHFLQKKCAEMNRPPITLTPRAQQALAAYRWPGNVRELENVIERTIVLSDGEEVDVDDLPLTFEQEGSGGPRVDLPEGEVPLTRVLEDLERQLIEKALDRAGGVKTRAAEMLGIKTSALYYKLDKYGLGETGGGDSEQPEA
jgi:two-component system response regulator HydG